MHWDCKQCCSLNSELLHVKTSVRNMTRLCVGVSLYPFLSNLPGVQWRNILWKLVERQKYNAGNTGNSIVSANGHSTEQIAVYVLAMLSYNQDSDYGLF